VKPIFKAAILILVLAAVSSMPARGAPQLMEHVHGYTFAGDRLQTFTGLIHIDSVLDWGPRVGVARDKGGTDTISGYAMSLKLGCNSCSVDHYGSNRPDGFMDVLPSYGLTVSNVFAEFDSSFLKNVYTAGLRFPATGYHNVVNLICRNASNLATTALRVIAQ
jgi:hypothetical protein